MRLKKWMTVFLAILLLATMAACGDKETPEESPSPSEEPGGDPGIPPGPLQTIGNTEGVAYSSDGMLVYPYGRISMPVGGERNQIGFQNATQDAFWNQTGEVTGEFDETEALIKHIWDDDSVDTAVTANEDGTLTVTQTARSASGVSAVSFGLNVPIRYDIILPIWGGVRLTEEKPDIDLKFTRLTYPDLWQAQMFLIQGTNGGLLVYAEDNATQFKALNVFNDDANFYLTVETIPQAPFDQYNEFTTVSWHMVPYKGDWNAGAMMYKEFAKEVFELDAIQDNKPEWAEQVQFVFLTDIEEPEFLDVLAEHVDPEKTLLIVPGFREFEYDTAYPDYTPKAGMKEKIRYARDLGYHVGLHFNMIGAAFDSPEYLEYIKDSHSLDAFTKEPINVTYTAYNKEFSFAQINPASKAWRDLMVETTAEVVRELEVDAIHFDQSLLCFNDGRGLVDGMTSMQGNVAFQRDLAQALPDIAFSGEGIHEMNFRYASWLQVHVYGLNNATETWDNERFNQICPLTTMMFDDYVTLYHYPAMPLTTKQEYYQAWHRAGSYRTGHIPTIMRQTLRQISEPNETLRMVLKEAKWFQDNQPKLNTEEWGEDVILSWVCADGSLAEYRRDGFGEVFLTDAENPDSVMTRIITGVENAKLPGSITGWQVYDDTFIRGLDPARTYLYNETPRDPAAFHIDAVPENTTLQTAEQNENYTVLNMAEIVDTSRTMVDFMRYAGIIRAGEVMEDGEIHALEEPFNSINAFWYTMEVQGQVRHLGDRLLMHPPWIDENAAPGFTYIEFDVPLEVCGNALFEAGAQMASQENADNSDGVIFKFFIWDAADESRQDMITYEVEAVTASPVPVALDIVRFEGKTVTVRIECHAGSTVKHDSSVVVMPRIIQRKASSDRQIQYTVVSDRPVINLLSTSGKAVIDSQDGQKYTITAQLSDTVYLIHDNQEIVLPLDLGSAPYTTSWIGDQGDISLPASDMVPSIQTTEVGGNLRRGILSPPPSTGRSEMYYLITVPTDGNAVISGLAGLMAQSDESDGVTFDVKINGQSIWNHTAVPNQEFSDFSLSLSDYAGQTVLLTLSTHSVGTNLQDNAFWCDPIVE